MADLIAVVDTSSLHSLGGQSNQARALKELCVEYVIELHVPWIVEREFATKLDEKVNTQVPRPVAQAAGWMTAEDRELLDSAIEELETVAKAVNASDGVREWLEECRAVCTDTDAVSSKSIFERYFAGEPPFKATKNRLDLPDGFIHAEVERLAQIGELPVHVVCADDTLRDACAEIPGVIVHEKFDSLFTVPEVSRHVKADEALEFCAGNLPQLIELLQPIASEAVLDKTVYSPLIPAENGEAIISGFGEATDIELATKEIEAIAHDTVMVPLRYRVPEKLADLCIYKGDYYPQRNRWPRVWVTEPDWNDHVLAAETEIDVDVEAVATAVVTRNTEGALAFGRVEIEIDEITLRDPFE